MSSASEPTESVIIENIETGISEYYKLKALYESKIADVKKNFLSNHGHQLPLPEKRARLDVLRNSVKCVNCRQAGGMTFSNENGELRVACNAARPCMNKLIKKPKYHHVETLMYDAHRDVELLKDRTIRLKLNLLFNYASEEDTVAEFGKLQKQMNDAFARYDQIRSRYYNVVQNADRAKKLHELNVEIQTEIQKIKSDLSSSRRQGGQQYNIHANDVNDVNDASDANDASDVESSVVADTVNRVYETLRPLLKMYSEVKYVYNEVIPDYDNENQSRLVQKTTGFKNMVQPILSTSAATAKLNRIKTAMS